MLTFSQQKAETGTVISNFGKTYNVSSIDFKTDTKSELKAVFDIGRTFKDSSKVSPLINTAARYLNMHVTAGVSFQNLKVAMVIHGSASDDILNNKEYQQKYGIDNPNLPLLEALSAKGAQIILCGQTAAYRNISKNEIAPQVHIALSAMTALVQLQNDNYRLINF